MEAWGFGGYEGQRRSKGRMKRIGEKYGSGEAGRRGIGKIAWLGRRSGKALSGKLSSATAAMMLVC